MKKIEDKIKKLEEEIRDDFEWGSTRIDSECLTEAEMKLFSHYNQMSPPIKFNAADVQLCKSTINKSLFYLVRRIFDLFMKVMNFQLLKSDERFVFWCRFIDFISETMYIINCQRGSDFVLHTRFGKNIDEWPEDDNPAWKEYRDWTNKWERDFEKIWKQISPIVEKILQNMGPPPEDDEHSNVELSNVPFLIID